jgi:perosamine synthetase
MTSIPVAGPWITQREVELVSEAVLNGWYENATVYQERFESAFAEYVERRFAIAVPHCTSALHLALAALDLKPGDEVVVPEITWIGSAAPVTYFDAVPVFADIDRRSWCMSADAFREVVSSRTRAVIVVDLYGGLPDMEQVLAIAQEHGIAVIEDAAQAIGARYRGRKAGSFGFASAFSFHGTKALTTGEGGMLLFDDESAWRRARILGDHGRVSNGKLFWNVEVAYKYRMSALQAALGLAQLERIDELIARKVQIFRWYQERLADLPGIALNNPGDGIDGTFWMVTVVLDPEIGIPKEALIEHLMKRGIGARPFFYPLSSLPAYDASPDAVRARERNGVAYALSPYGLNLPSGYNMTEALVDHVCAVFRQALEGSSATTRTHVAAL